MSLHRMPFISSVKLARIDDSYIIPTAIYYDRDKPHIGREEGNSARRPSYWSKTLNPNSEPSILMAQHPEEWITLLAKGP